MNSDTFDESATWAMGAALGFLALLTLLLPREEPRGVAQPNVSGVESSVDFSLHGDRLIRDGRAQARR